MVRARICTSTWRDLKPLPLPLGYTRDWCSEGDSNTHHRRSERRVSADWTTGAVLAGGFDPSASGLTQDGVLRMGEASKMVLRAWNRTCGLPLTRRLLFRLS